METTALTRNQLLLGAPFVLALVGLLATAGQAVALEAGGPISVDTTWRLVDSPVFVRTTNVRVWPGVTLTIEPGVVVRLDAGRSIYVEGTLVARGTTQAPVTFTSNAATPRPGDWGRIVFADSSVDASYDGAEAYASGSILDHCVVELAGAGATGTAYGAVVLDRAAPAIEQCILRDNSTCAIQGTSAAPLRIRGCEIARNGGELDGFGGGIVLGTTSLLVVEDCHVHDCRGLAVGGISVGAPYGDLRILRNQIERNGRSSALWMRGAGWGRATASGNLIRLNRANSSVVFAGNCLFEGNLLVDNAIDAVEACGALWADGAAVRRNVIARNSILSSMWPARGSVYLTGGTWGVPHPEFSNNTVVHNTTGQARDTGGVCWDVGPWVTSPTFRDSNVWGNGGYQARANFLAPHVLSAVNCYWGTTDRVAIDALLLDYYDDAAKGEIRYSPFADAPVETAPLAPPTGLAAQPGTTFIDLSWNANREHDVVGYHVCRGLVAGGPYQRLTQQPVSGTAWRDSAVSNAVLYFYVVTAVDASAEESYFSNEASAQTAGSPPTASASASPTSGTAPLVVQFTGTATDDGAIALYEWDWTSDGTWDFASSTSGSASHTYAAVGQFTATFRVTDDEGLRDQRQVVIQTTAQAQPPSPSLSATPVSGQAPLTVSFGFSGTDPDGRVVLYELDFDGDGAFDRVFAAPGTTSFTFGAAGRFLATLRVTDNDGLQATQQVLIDVSAPPRPLTAAAEASPRSGEVPLRVTLTGTADAQEGVLAWLWDYEGDGTYDWVSFDTGSVTRTYTEVGEFTPTLRVIDRVGQSATASVGVTTRLPADLRVWISTPRDGDSIGGNDVSVRAHAAPANLVASVQFQVRRSGDPSWTDLGARLVPPPSSYGIRWDVSGLADGQVYELRAVATDTRAREVSSEAISVWIDNSDGAERSERRTASGDGVLSHALHRDRTVLADSMEGMEALVPARSVEDGARIEVARLAENPHRTDREGGAIGVYRGVRFTGGQDPTRSYRLRLPYADRGNDGLVDGTTIAESALRPYRFDATAGAWLPVAGWTQRPAENDFEFDVQGGGDFALYASAPGRVLEPREEHLVLGLGRGSAGWMPALGGRSTNFAPRTWARLPWATYNAASGETRPAAGDLDGDGLDECVVGLGRGGQGYLAVFADGRLVRWVRVPWSAYGSSNGETWPACGDVDGDGKDEIVVGLGSSSAGRFYVFDDLAAGCSLLATRLCPWTAYNSANGELRPAVGDLDRDGGEEVVFGLGSGGGGSLLVVDDAASSYAVRGWRRVPWGSYSGPTYPALGNLDGEGRDELVVGLGSLGWVVTLREGQAPVWRRVGWAAYNAACGETRPALGDIDADGREELAVGLGRGGAGRVAVWDDASTVQAFVGWVQAPWPAYDAANGETWPTMARR